MPNIIANKMKSNILTQFQQKLKNIQMLIVVHNFITNIEHKTALWF